MPSVHRSGHLTPCQASDAAPMLLRHMQYRPWPRVTKWPSRRRTNGRSGLHQTSGTIEKHQPSPAPPLATIVRVDRTGFSPNRSPAPLVPRTLARGAPPCVAAGAAGIATMDPTRQACRPPRRVGVGVCRPFRDDQLPDAVCRPGRVELAGCATASKRPSSVIARGSADAMGSAATWSPAAR